MSSRALCFVRGEALARNDDEREARQLFRIVEKYGPSHTDIEELKKGRMRTIDREFRDCGKYRHRK